MLVSPNAIYGTIGGGQLEFMAIDRAREMLGGAPVLATLDIPLGPEIGQCCGGRVEVAISLVDKARREALLKAAKADEARRPHVLIFGGGHVGHALAAAFALLPVRPVVVETRQDALDGIAPAVETRLTPVPEEMVREASAGAAFVVLTHDHALDFLIVAEALKRGDAAYVGMIGSKTKKATFRSWFLKTAGGTEDGICAPSVADRRRHRQGQAPCRHCRACGGRDHDGAGRRRLSLGIIPSPGCAPPGTTATCRARGNRR